MSWRTVVVSTRCKLDTKMGYLVIRGEQTRRIFLDEIAVVLIEDPAVSLTGCLLEALTERKVRVIFCGAKRSPVAELVPYSGSADSSGKLRSQIAWTAEAKDAVWRRILAEKIRQQADHLAARKHGREAVLLESYLPQIEYQDRTNREGHAAKVYFNALFGMDFSRTQNTPRNAALNYGYGILLSAFNRELAANGYLTQLGVHHDNAQNPFNLSSDLMEPFRVLIDREVADMELQEFTKEEKHALVNVLNRRVVIAGTEQTVLNAVRIYVRSVLSALNDGGQGMLLFYEV